MNSANVLKLADFIEAHEELKFNITFPYKPTCETAGCVAGFAAVLWPKTVGTLGNDSDVPGWNSEALMAELGIDREIHDDLCFPYGMLISKIDRAQAIKTLRELVETGKVVYPKAD